MPSPRPFSRRAARAGATGLLVASLLLAAGACSSPAPEGPEASSQEADTDSLPPARDTLAMKAGGPLLRRPTAPLRIEGACPFECCTYGSWTTTASTTVFQRAGDTTAVAFTVPAGTTLEAPTGFVLLTQIGTAVTRDTASLYRRDGTARRTPPGDTLLLLDYVGEGTHHTWYADSVYQTGLWAPVEPLREAQAQWWARVKGPGGRAGWLWMDQTPTLRGVDACG